MMLIKIINSKLHMEIKSTFKGNAKAGNLQFLGHEILRSWGQAALIQGRVSDGAEWGSQIKITIMI